jgi:hypothetical protein
VKASEELQSQDWCLIRCCFYYDNVHTSPRAGLDVLLMMFDINLISKHCCSHIVFDKGFVAYLFFSWERLRHALKVELGTCWYT